MPALAPAPTLRLEEPTFCEGIARYVAAMCPRFGIRRADVKDVVQDALLNIAASLETFRPERGEFDKWARGVAMNVIRKHARGARRDAAIFCEYHPNAEYHAALEPSPEYCARKTEARRAILNAAETLSTLKAQIVVLHVVEGMTHKDIGKELQISAANSEKTCQRTLEHLAGCVPHDVLSVMPPALSTCDDPVSFNEKDSRWPETSHYLVQIAAAIMAAFFVYPAIHWMQSSPALEEGLVQGTKQNAVMGSIDKHADVHDELVVLRDAPSGKPEPVQVTKVRDVSTPAKIADKPTHVQEYVPRLSYKHESSAVDYRPNGR